MQREQLAVWAGTLALAGLVLLLGGFSLFVGYHKTFSPIAVLAQNSAWTAHLPVWLGRAVGVAELLAAAVLFAGLVRRPLARAGFWAGVWITANHAVATLVHVIHAEWHTLTSSAVYIAMGLAMCALYAWRVRRV